MNAGRVLVPLAPGFEEIEAVTIIDLLRRADIEVVCASLGDRRVTGSHGITIEADTTLDAARASDIEFAMIVLPGGMPGARHLRDDARVQDLVRTAVAAGRYAAAICAAPMALAAAGLLAQRRATSFPGFLDPDAVAGLELVDAPVVVDGPIITSRGPGTAMEFALVLVATLAGSARRAEIESRLQKIRIS
jgi:4-methyl-5(b-hydroxyethyl)-thiazole monophosphate biosynthesis